MKWLVLDQVVRCCVYEMSEYLIETFDEGHLPNSFENFDRYEPSSPSTKKRHIRSTQQGEAY